VPTSFDEVQAMLKKFGLAWCRQMYAYVGKIFGSRGLAMIKESLQLRLATRSAWKCRAYGENPWRTQLK
jgi:hypothetical protein